MTTIKEVRDALGRQIADANPALTYTPVLTQNASLPAVLVTPPANIEYLGTMGRDGQWGRLDFRVYVFFATHLLFEAVDVATDALESAGPWSVWKAVMDDQTLGGVLGIGGATVMTCRELSYEEAERIGHSGLEWTVQIAMRKET